MSEEGIIFTGTDGDYTCSVGDSDYIDDFDPWYSDLVRTFDLVTYDSGSIISSATIQHCGNFDLMLLHLHHGIFIL